MVKCDPFVTWLNVIRLFSMFNKNDLVGLMLIEKLTFFAMSLQCAMTITSYYIASNNGSLELILNQSKVSAEFVKDFRNLTTLVVLMATMVDASTLSLFGYALFFTDGSFDFLLAPFVTQIPQDELQGGWMYVAKLCVTLYLLSITQLLIWLIAMNSLLSQLLVRQFRILNGRFHSAIDRRGKFKGDIKIFRNRHQALSSSDLLHGSVNRFSRLNAVVFPPGPQPTS